MTTHSVTEFFAKDDMSNPGFQELASLTLLKQRVLKTTRTTWVQYKTFSETVRDLAQEQLYQSVDWSDWIRERNQDPSYDETHHQRWLWCVRCLGDLI